MVGNGEARPDPNVSIILEARQVGLERLCGNQNLLSLQAQIMPQFIEYEPLTNAIKQLYVVVLLKGVQCRTHRGLRQVQRASGDRRILMLRHSQKDLELFER